MSNPVELHNELLEKITGSLTAVRPVPEKQLVTIGNSPEVFRITEIIARGGYTGTRMVASAHSVSTKLPKVGIELHELREVA